MWWFALSLLLILSVFFMFVRAKPAIWLSSLGIVLAAFSPFLPLGFSVPLACILGLVALLFSLGSLRRAFLIRPLMKAFRHVLPPMSETEREALEAGKVFWEGELFQGKPDWNKLHSYPIPTLNEAEQAFLANEVETLCKQLDDFSITRDVDLLPETWDYLKQKGFFGMLIPRQYGGLGFSALMQSTVVMKIATRNISAAVTTMVPNSLGPAELLLHYGTEEQKNYYLPRLAIGDEVPCFALTSTEGGSDAGAMPDEGIVCKALYKGVETLGIRLNFSKRYITLAPVATVIGLAFKLYDPDRLLGGEVARGITCALLPADHPGVEVGRRHYPVYTSFMNGPVSGHDVFIPLDWVIGGSKMIGQGWRMLMECLSAGRGISLPALGAAVGAVAYRTTGAYAVLREQFKVSIGQFEGVQEALAHLGGFHYLIESCRLFTAGAVDFIGKPSLASAIAKYHITELARKVNDAAMDIHAGRAIQAGPRNYLATLYLHAPVAITVEGANILTRNLMIFGQGAVRCHPYVFAEMQALSNSNAEVGLRDFDGLLLSHVGYALSNFARTFIFGFFGTRFIRVPHNPLSSYYRELTRMSSALALSADVAMLMLGGDLKRRENLSARFGDVLSYLYLSSAVLKYAVDQGLTAEHLVYARWALEYALYQIQQAFYGIFANFPGVMGSVLKGIIFPWGRSYALPKDELGKELAAISMAHGEFREFLTKQVYFAKNSKDSIGRIECAFDELQKVQPLLDRVKLAIREKKLARHNSMAERLEAIEKAGIFSGEEFALLRQFEMMRLDAMEVDDFPSDFFKKTKRASKKSAKSKVEVV